MSDYLTEGWPLSPTSTVYMDGTAVYVVRRYGIPGATNVVLRCEHADLIREVVAERIEQAKAEAWDEALQARASWMQDQRYYSEDEVPNPYRIEHDECCPHPKCPGGGLCCCLSEQGGTWSDPTPAGEVCRCLCHESGPALEHLGGGKCPCRTSGAINPNLLRRGRADS